MAKRRRKSGGRSRGRVGSVSTRGKGYSDLLLLAGGAIAGGSLAVYAGNMLGDKLPPKGKAIGQVAAGAVIAQQAKHPFVQGVGVGFITAGGTTLLKQTGMLSGADDMYYDDGYGDDNYMGADVVSDDDQGPLDMMSGDDDAF